MTPSEAEQIQLLACAIHERFDDQSPFWFTVMGNGDLIRFLGLRDGKAATDDARLNAEPHSAAHCELKMHLIRTLRRLGRVVYNDTDDIPDVLADAIEAGTAKSIH